MNFTNYFSKEVKKIKVIKKSESLFMKMVYIILVITDWLHITNISKEFMSSYTTTIGNRIYTDDRWPVNGQPTRLVVHELTHVLLWSFKYAINYVFSKTWRARYESYCIATEMLIFPEKRTLLFIEGKADMLVKYGIPKDISMPQLLFRLEEIPNMELPSVCAKMLQAVDKWHKI